MACPCESVSGLRLLVLMNANFNFLTGKVTNKHTHTDSDIERCISQTHTRKRKKLCFTVKMTYVQNDANFKN